MINEHQIGLRGGDSSRYLLKLADAKQRGWVRTVTALYEFTHNFRAGRGGQFAEFGKRFLHAHTRVGSVFTTMLRRSLLAACGTGDNGSRRHRKVAIVFGTMAKFNRYEKRPLRSVTTGDDLSRFAWTARTLTGNGLALHFGRSAFDLSSHMVPATAFTVVGAAFGHDHR